MNLTVKRVEKALRRGERDKHFDGDGLYLVVNGKGVGNWSRRYELNGKAHWMGLGSVKAFNLAEARERNRRVSQQLADGIDPLVQKHAAKAAQAAAAASKLSFKEACQQYLAAHDAGWSNRHHARQWVQSLQCYALPHLGGLDVTEIEVPHVLRVLEQPVPAFRDLPSGSFWTARTVSADRTRNRIESVLSWCMARGHRPKGPNPAAWSGNLEHVLPSPSKVARKAPHPAVPYQELPALMAALATREGVGVKALAFLIMTAARAGEVLGARWDEIDAANAVWTVPAARMKGRREHRVPLSPEALALLDGLYREQDNPFVFIGARGQALSSTALTKTLHRVGRSETVHGMRAAFSTWAHERTGANHHVVEICLAHTVGSEVERAYRRSDLFQKRHALMEQWARYCSTPSAAGDVVPLRGKAAADA